MRFVEKQYFDRSDGPLKGIVATVAATDLINLVKDPELPEKINDNVFNENIRIYLKLDNRINRGIYDTALSDENYEFWYLNNGITIVCEECTYTPNTRSPLVNLKNLQIVNGGQTTNALFEAYLKNPEKLDNILVIVRICETKNYRISEKISETTNSQTPIKTRDLHSNDRIQKKLEDEFKSLGYYYERKRNQFIDQPKSKRLDSELLGQLYMAYYLDMASQAKNNKSLIFSEEYDNIFNENIITASSMLIPHKIYLPLDEMKRDIQRKKRRKEKISERDAFISRATFHLLNSVRIIAEKENLKAEEDKDINRAIELAIKYVNDVVELQSKKRGDLYTHDKFFKEIQTNKIISDYISGLYPTN
ncbi:MAG: AIPR family protein [Desulfobaccales bacterium]